MSDRVCHYFLTLSQIFDHPDAHDHHITRFLRLVRLSYQKSGVNYAPIKMSNPDLARLWKCNEAAARACLADLKMFDWLDTKQIGQHERLIILKAVWRNDGKDGARETNAPLTSDLHPVQARATAAPLPAQSTDDLAAEGAIHVRTLNTAPIVVVGTDLNDDCTKDSYQQQQNLNPVRTAAEGANHVRTLNECANVNRTIEEINQIVDALWDLDIRTEDAIDIILGKTRERFKDGFRDYSHVTPEYLEDWVVHRQITKEKLGGGFYRMQIRERRESPYRMSAKQRAKYRAECEREHAADDAEPVEEQMPERDEFGVDEIESELEPTPAPAQASSYHADGTADLWDKTLRELKLQMRKATFDTWVRDSRALGWDDSTGDLVIAVHSPYAKEWLEARLSTTVNRTLRGIVERDIAVRYEVA